MIGENVFKTGTPENRVYEQLMDGVYEAGWWSEVGGTTSTGEIYSHFILPRYIAPINTRELQTGLALSDDKGDLVPGYRVGDDVDGVYVGYDGKFTEHYAATLATMRAMIMPDQATGARPELFGDPSRAKWFRTHMTQVVRLALEAASEQSNPA